jgi:hypothetical protein
MSNKSADVNGSSCKSWVVDVDVTPLQDQTHIDEALLYLSLYQTVSIPELHVYLTNKFDDFSITGSYEN